MTTNTSRATKILDRISGRRLQDQQAAAEHMLNSQSAELVLAARERANLTQRQLARLVQTPHSTISRLEDADYDDNALVMLQKIAEALDQRVEVRLVETMTKRGATTPRRRRTAK